MDPVRQAPSAPVCSRAGPPARHHDTPGRTLRAGHRDADPVGGEFLDQAEGHVGRRFPRVKNAAARLRISFSVSTWRLARRRRSPRSSLVRPLAGPHRCRPGAASSAGPTRPRGGWRGAARQKVRRARSPASISIRSCTSVVQARAFACTPVESAGSRQDGRRPLARRSWRRRRWGSRGRAPAADASRSPGGAGPLVQQCAPESRARERAWTSRQLHGRWRQAS